MTPDTRAVRSLVYETFAAQGRAPSIAEIARHVGRTPAQVSSALRDLAGEHALVLSRDGDAIRMAHPFSAAPMAFVVTPADGHDDRRWWGGCAWDSFGISAALGLEVRIDTACPRCGIHLSLECGPRTPPRAGTVIRFPWPAAQWWDDVVGTCTAIRLFCSQEHADGPDDAAGARESRGQTVDAIRVWRLAQDWYGDRLDPDYVPQSPEHRQNLLTAQGLSGPFWDLG